MIPKKLAPALFSLILSGLMSFLVSGVSTFRAIGFVPEFVHTWLTAWLAAWAVAFPAVMVVAPLARRVVEALTTEHSGKGE